MATKFFNLVGRIPGIVFCVYQNFKAIRSASPFSAAPAKDTTTNG
jgi:hypothetical protein